MKKNNAQKEKDAIKAVKAKMRESESELPSTAMLSDEDKQFLYGLMPEWVKDTPRGLCPTIYGTGSLEGDIEIKRRVDYLLR